MKYPISKKIPLYCFILSLISYSSKAQQPTWENGIACIIYTHCSPCHNPNGIAPFSLMSYEDAVDNIYGIKSTVNSGEMPPYPPDRSYQHYQNERYLSDDEKSAIQQWIKARAPSGDLSKALTPPEFDNKSEITDPDFSAIIPVFTVPEITEDLYRCFVISNPFPEAKMISGIEVIPGNKSIVHHVQIVQDTSDVPLILDSADALPGYTMFGGIGSNTAQHITGWTPSAGAYFLPGNMGIKLNRGSRIIIQVHYPAGSSGQVDSTRVNLKFINSGGPHVRTVNVERLLSADLNLMNGPFIIAANKVKKFYVQSQLPQNVNLSLLGVASHAHLICVSMKTYAVKPNGDTVPLLNIKHWDFHWQGAYMFKEMITLPGGTMLYGEAVYDNTVNNPHNPNNPPKRVKRGEATTDEMMAFYFPVLKTKPGDDIMVFDTTTRLPTYNNCSFVFNSGSAVNKELSTENIEEKSVGSNIVSIYPNPIHDKLQLTLKGAEPAKVLVYTINGQLVYESTAKPGNNQFNLQHLPNGFYLIKILNQKVNTTVRFLKA